jgi:hypothetical protein
VVERSKAAWRRRRRKYALFLAVLVAAPAGAYLAARWTRDTEGTRPSLAQLAAKNYRTLSVAESRRLLRYAETEYQCIVAHGGAIMAPVPSGTRITMTARNRSARELVRLMTACDPKVGPPPPGASLQARPEQVLVYLPKRCLLDPTTLHSATS